MRTISISIATAAALLSVPAYAQMHTPGAREAPGATAPSHPSPHTAAKSTPKLNPLKQSDITKIVGTPVDGADGKHIGNISAVLVRPDTKKIDKLVVHSGGILGFGGHRVALALNQFTWDAAKGAFALAKTTKDLDRMAEWKPTAANAATASGSSEPAALPPTSPSNKSVLPPSPRSQDSSPQH